MIGQYILDGHTPVPCDDPIAWVNWMALNAEDERRRVAETTVGDIWVSTVFLGLDHNWYGTAPLLFETMAFLLGDSISCDRYSTWQDAEDGHHCVVRATEYQVNIAKLAGDDVLAAIMSQLIRR